MAVARSSRPVRFGVFEVDLRAGELRNQGVKLRLPEQSFQILAMLLERPGELVTREEIQKRLWPDDTVVEFDNSISAAIRRLRLALGDSADEPRFVETLARRGYRFMVAVDQETDRTEVIGGELAPQRVTARPYRARRWLWVYSVGLIGSLAVVVYLRARPLPVPRVLRSSQITDDGKRKSWIRIGGAFSGSPLVTDGPRIYFQDSLGRPTHLRLPEYQGSEHQIAQVSASGGETTAIPTAFGRPSLLDISHDGSVLLVSAGTWQSAPALWVVPTLGGSPHKLGDIAPEAATWSPDGKYLAYTKANDLFLARSDGSQSRILASFPKPVHHLRWSPDSTHIRLTIGDRVHPSRSLWQVAADGTNIQPLLPGWNDPPRECCGHWTADGRYFVFLSTRDGVTNIWAIREKKGFFDKADRTPVQLTTGPMHFHNLLPSRDGKKLFVLGATIRGELMRYDSETHQFVPYLGGMSAYFLDFTRDGQWVTYVTHPEYSLWRSRLDGSERLQLTFPPVKANLPRWSPDGTRIAFNGTGAPDKGSRVFLVSAAGGELEEACVDDVAPQTDPSWSPDGKSLAWGRPPKELDPFVPAPPTIQVLDLKTRQVSTLPGSQGRFHPAWSPDGRYIAAYHEDWHMVLFDVATQKWTEVTDFPVLYHQWSRDGKHLYFGRPPSIYRMRITDRKIEQVPSLAASQRVFGWFGLAPDDAPVVLDDVGNQEIYALDVEFP